MVKSIKPTEYVAQVLKDFIPEKELELYHCDFKKEGRDWYLNVYIDKTKDPESGEERYVSSDECELVSRYLSAKLDEDDPIEQNYYLTVSSPGLDRQLYEQKDYDRFAGRSVEVRLFAAINKKKEYEGTLVGLIDDRVVIKSDNGDEINFPIKQVAKTCLKVEF